MRISDWSSDVCSSDLKRQPVQELGERIAHAREVAAVVLQVVGVDVGDDRDQRVQAQEAAVALVGLGHQPVAAAQARVCAGGEQLAADDEGRVEPAFRSAEHTSELQSLMRISYAVFCLKKKK